MHRLLFIQCAIFMFTRTTLLLPLVIISLLHNHKQNIGNIGVRDHFSRLEGIFKLACIYSTRQNLEENNATYTQVYTLCGIENELVDKNYYFGQITE